MYDPDSEEFKKSHARGEWRERNGKWYRAIVKKEWEAYALQTCITCGKKFLTRHHSQACSKSCGRKAYWKSLPKEQRWKTKRMHTEHGYVYVRDETGKIVAEHRYIMSKMMQRPLDRSEHVHHINGNREDNRPENLLLVTRSGHNVMHKREQAKNWSRDEDGRFS